MPTVDTALGSLRSPNRTWQGNPLQDDQGARLVGCGRLSSMDVSSDEPQAFPNESVRRLQPTPETLRQLYLLSGNECAFLGCREPIIGDNGDFIGQICHIEGAMPGGERFNAAMTNEQRRAPSNLMLMCYRHHVETNDVNAYSTERMREIKAEHEKRYSEGVRRLIASVIDSTISSTITPPVNLRAFHNYHGWANFTEEEIEGEIEAVTQLARRLQVLSRPAREMLVLVLRRGREVSKGWGEVDYGVLLQEIEDVTGMVPHEILARVGQLSGRGLAYIEDENWQFDGFVGPFVRTSDLVEYPTWAQLRAYCDANKISIAKLVVELRFDMLDEAPTVNNESSL